MRPIKPQTSALQVLFKKDFTDGRTLHILTLKVDSYCYRAIHPRCLQKSCVYLWSVKVEMIRGRINLSRVRDTSLLSFLWL